MSEISKPRRLCVFLLQLGGPSGPSEIEPFVASVLHDALQVPNWARRHLVSFLAHRRAQTLERLYNDIGGGSPLRHETEKQAQALERQLCSRGFHAKVLVVMRHAPPRAEEAIAEARRYWSDAMWVALPLYPQYSYATTRSSLDELMGLLTTPEQERLLAINAYPADRGYLDAIAACVRDTLQTIPGAMRRSTHIVFTAHGSPLKLVRQADPYREHLQQSVDGVYQRLAVTWPMHLVFQQTTGVSRRLTPEIHDTIARLGHEGVRSVVVVPISFLSERLETLYGLDVHARELAKAAGIMDFRRVATPGARAELITALADLVAHAVPRDV